MKVVQFGLRYSPNLGDGVIAECIALAIAARRPDATVVPVDLSGRKAFGEVMVANRERILAVIDRLPLSLRQALVTWKLSRLLDRVAPQWQEAVDGADLAIIGGGQIFADANLNFPLKIARASAVLAASGTPTAVYGVGVARNWTRKGAALFAKVAETDLRMIGVRDAGSDDAWRAQMRGGPAPELTLDPGLLAVETYGAVPAAEGLGLCVTDFTLLAHHATGSVAGAAQSARDFYVAIAETAAARGHVVCLFCNGAAEDAALLAEVAGDPRIIALRATGSVRVPDTPRTPTALVAIIAGCATIVAHRLHACIVAYSYRRGIVGLGWDAKLESFFQTAGVAAHFSKDPALTPARIVDMAEAALADGIDPQHHADLMAQAWDGIDRVLACARASTH